MPIKGQGEKLFFRTEALPVLYRQSMLIFAEKSGSQKTTVLAAMPGISHTPSYLTLRPSNDSSNAWLESKSHNRFNVFGSGILIFRCWLRLFQSSSGPFLRSVFPCSKGNKRLDSFPPFNPCGRSGELVELARAESGLTPPFCLTP
jgi:hypothetical protein